MTATTSFPLTRTPRDQTFPTLTPDQIARVAAHGHVRPIRTGEVLFEAGDAVRSFFLVRIGRRSEEHTSELQSQSNLVCRLLLEKKKNTTPAATHVAET